MHWRSLLVCALLSIQLESVSSYRRGITSLDSTANESQVHWNRPQSITVHQKGAIAETQHQVQTDQEQHAARQSRALIAVHSPTTKVVAAELTKVGAAKQVALAKGAKALKKSNMMGLAIRAAATVAKLVVWGAGLALCIAFPPAALAVAGGQALLGFIISCTALRAQGKSFSDFKGSDWCALFLEVGQNMLVGWTGGTSAAGEILILTSDVAEMAYTESTGKSGTLARSCGITSLEKSREALNAARAANADAFTEGLRQLGFDLDTPQCDCEDCKYKSSEQLCEDTPCVHYFATHCPDNYGCQLDGCAGNQL